MPAMIRMPALAAGAEEAAIQAWLVEVGTRVEAGQSIAEIETEKAVVEYLAEQSGVLAGILVPAGEAAAVGSPIAVIALGGETPQAALAAVEPEEQAVAGPSPAAGPAPAPAVREPAAPRRLFASPLVRRLARERGLDLEQIRGTGPNGRIVRRDVDDPQNGGHDPRNGDESTPTHGEDLRTQARVDVVAHTGMRRAIARRLTESIQSIPQFHLSADCRVDELMALRAQLNGVPGVSVSLNDLVVKATAWALQDVPDVNAIWTDEAMHRFHDVDIAVAVSIPGGLLTPVVRGADRLSISQLGAVVRELADRANQGRLQQHELTGGAFSVSNLGMHGVRDFTAIINPPHAGILAVGAVRPQPVVSEDGTVDVARVMTVTLAADHRVVDGVLAAQWLKAFVTRIEHPTSLLV